MSARPNRLAGLAVAAVLGACALNSCSSGAADEPSSSDKGKTSANKTIAFVSPAPAFPQWRTFGDCLADAAKGKGYELVETGPSGTGDPSTGMITQVQQATANKVSAIMTLPASPAFGPLLTQAQEAGIATTTLYGDGSAESGADVNVGVDFGKLGALYVDAIAARPGEQRLGLVASDGTGIGKSWIDGVKGAVAETDNVTIVGEVYTADDASKALPQTTALLTAHPDVNVVASHMGSATPGVVAALDSKGLTSDVAFLGNGGSNGGTEALASGAAYRLLLQDVCGGAKAAMDATIAAIEEGPEVGGVPTQVFADAVMSSEEDIQSYLDEGWQ